MALVKKARVASRKPKAAGKTAPVDNSKVSTAQVATGAKARQTRAVERIAVATEQLASGVTEAAAAAEELRRGMGQVAAAGRLWSAPSGKCVSD